MYTLNPRETTKIPKHTTLANKTEEEIKWNIK